MLSSRKILVWSVKLLKSHMFTLSLHLSSHVSGLTSIHIKVENDYGDVILRLTSGISQCLIVLKMNFYSITFVLLFFICCFVPFISPSLQLSLSILHYKECCVASESELNERQKAATVVFPSITKWPTVSPVTYRVCLFHSHRGTLPLSFSILRQKWVV